MTHVNVRRRRCSEDPRNRLAAPVTFRASGPIGTISMEIPSLPLWASPVAVLAALLVAREIGKYVRDRRPEQSSGSDSYTITSVLGLLGLLIGFSFSIALTRYEQRRDLVVQEANAIGTAWLRMQLLPPGESERMRAMFRRYVDIRVAFGDARSPEAETAQYRRAQASQALLWNALMTSVAPMRDSPAVLLLVDATNEAFDLAAERFAVRQAHIPSRILRLLAIFALLAAGIVGYQRGAERKITTVLFILLTLAISLVIDLDRPTAGMIKVPQEPMLQLRDSLDGSRPGAQPVARVASPRAAIVRDPAPRNR